MYHMSTFEEKSFDPQKKLRGTPYGFFDFGVKTFLSNSRHIIYENGVEWPCECNGEVSLG